MEPMHTTVPVTSFTHRGSGVPQTRLREIAQSRAPSSQLPKRPSRMCSGTQCTCAFTASSRSRRDSTFTYQEGIAR